MDLKSIITIIIAFFLSLSFGFVVLTTLDVEMAKSIVSTFLTIATSVIGFFIGYQTNKASQAKVDESESEE